MRRVMVAVILEVGIMRMMMTVIVYVRMVRMVVKVVIKVRDHKDGGEVLYHKFMHKRI